MNGKKHYGWTNYETWAVKAHIDNDEEACGWWNDQTIQAGSDKNWLADRLKASFEDDRPVLTGPYCEWLQAAASRVNWLELASTMISDREEK